MALQFVYQNKDLIIEALVNYIDKNNKDMGQVQGNIAKKKRTLREHPDPTDKIYRGYNRDRYYGDIDALDSKLEKMYKKTMKLIEIRDRMKVVEEGS